MSDEIERQLSESLRRRAEGMNAQPDWNDLSIRRGRSERRRLRLVTVGVVLLLAAGPIAGYAVARATESNGPSVIAGGAGPRSAGKRAAQAVGGCSDAPTCGPLQQLFRRTTGDLTVRAYRWAGSPDCPAGIVAELSNAGAVALPAAPVEASGIGTVGGGFGDAEGTPVRFLIIQLGSNVGPRTETARVTFEGAGTDEMHPATVDADHAVAVLAVNAPEGTPLGATIELLDASGSTIERSGMAGGIGVPSLPCGTRSPPTTAPQQTPPPPSTLPPAGKPPADEDAARKSVHEAYEGVYAANASIQDVVKFVDDTHGLEQAITQLDQNIPNARPTLSIDIREIRFVNPNEAAVLYDIRDANGAWLNRVGKSVPVNGKWMVTRETVCRDITLGMTKCPP
jgi:hypothetical protein